MADVTFEPKNKNFWKLKINFRDILKFWHDDNFFLLDQILFISFLFCIQFFFHGTRGSSEDPKINDHSWSFFMSKNNRLKSLKTSDDLNSHG